jgi:adenosyl cobinamide kinase/adenosyl cobinamide phosphate guanylyltransferase
MAMTVLLGGVRSGKSSAAQSLAQATGRPVTYLATATPGDDEMAERIHHHRNERPSHWTTLEVPIELGEALAEIADSDTVIIDCLTLWLSNMMGDAIAAADITFAATTAAGYAADRAGETIVVTNEVGLGLVPPNPLGREFRDLAGRINRVWVDRSAKAGFVIAGRILPLVEFSDWKESPSEH